MARGRVIAVRLDAEELAALRRIAGENDSARLRALLHRQTVGSEMVQSIAEAVAAKLQQRIQADGNETRKMFEQIKSGITEVYKRLDQKIAGLPALLKAQ